MIYATCHADREHVAHGLCDCCYRRTVYYAEREARLKRLAAYYAKNAVALRASAVRLRASRGAVSRGTRKKSKPRIAILPAKALPIVQDKSWWREEAKPRRWTIEAQQEAAA